MKNSNTLKTMMNAWILDNKEYIQEDVTISDHMINECENTDWNWFMTDEKIDNYTSSDVKEVKEFLQDNYDYNVS